MHERPVQNEAPAASASIGPPPEAESESQATQGGKGSEDGPLDFASAPELMTVEETAEVLRMSPRAIYERLRLGEWNDVAFKPGKEWRIDRDALKEALRSGALRRKQPAEDPMPQSARARFEAELDAARTAQPTKSNPRRRKGRA